MEGLIELLDETNLRAVVTVVAIIAGTFAVGRLLVYVVIDLILLRLAKRTATSLDNLLADAARRPLYFIVVLTGFNIAVGQLGGLDDSLQVVIQDALFVLVMVVGSYLAYRLLLDVLTWYAEEVAQRTETRFDEQFTGFIQRLLQIAMVMVVGIMILSKLEVDVSGLVAGLGVGSLAVALAAQTLLENTIAGFHHD
jgi:MscS family membrane protein